MSDTPPARPDVEIIEATKAFERFLRVDVFRFRHRLFSGEWSALRSYDALRRGQAAAIVLYDPDRESVVLVEQFRLPALLAGSSPWQLETAAGLIDSGETPAAVAIRETQEETGLALIGEPIPDPALSAFVRRLRRKRIPVLRTGRRHGRRRRARPGGRARGHPRRRQNPRRNRGSARPRHDRKRPHHNRPLLAAAPPPPPPPVVGGA